MRDWLKGLPVADRHQVGHHIGVVEYGWPIGMPVCRNLGDGLWEIRSDHLTRSQMARRMQTSRPQLDRILDPANGGVTLDTLARAAKAVGRKVSLELV